MTSDQRHRRRTELFLEACEIDESQREQFLAEVCGEDVELRREVERMLAADTDAEGFLESPVLGEEFRLEAGRSGERPAAPATPAAVVPGSIGNYRILGVLGEGGMGVVYRAEQRNPARIVALKVLRSSAADAHAVRRLEMEAQVLARLHHPNIAHVYEAGAFESDRGRQPFLAMELIEGEPLQQYLQQHSLSTPQRLDLFLQICRAVTHAHQRGVIHRDLKPANVLVVDGGDAEHSAHRRESGDVAQVKVLDFGIARVIADDWQNTLVTGAGQILGTLAYMSPEQIEGEADEIDTRADVYALGVMLYEVLCGRLPHDLRGKTLPRAVQILRREEPQPLAGVDRALRGDLEVIVSKALERDRGARYPSAAELAEDIQRCLRGEAILARPHTTLYQLRKFARRHTHLVGAAAAVLLALMLGVAGLSKYAIDVSRARAEAVTARDEARERSNQLQQVADFQAAMLSDVDPHRMGLHLRQDLLAEFRAAHERIGHVGEPSDDALAEMLEDFERHLTGINFTSAAMKGLERNLFRTALDAVNRNFADQPLLRAQLLQNIAGTMATLGLRAEAEAPQEEALAIRRQHLGPDHPDTLTSLVASGELLSAGGRFEEAEAIYVDALERLRRTAGNDDERTLQVRLRLADTWRGFGRLDESRQWINEVYQRARRALGPEHEVTVAALRAMAMAAFFDGDSPTAERHFSEALEIQRRVLGEDHPDTLATLGNIAGVLSSLGLAEEAVGYSRSVVERRLSALGREHPGTLAAMTNLAQDLLTLGEDDEAEEILRQVVATQERLFGPQHPDTFIGLHNLARAMIAQGRLEEAEAYAGRCFEGRRRIHGEYHMGTVSTAWLLIEIMLMRGRPEQAVDLGEQALQWQDRLLAEDNWHRSTLLTLHGRTLAALARFNEAEPLLLEAHRVLAGAVGPDDQRTRHLAQRLIDFYEQWSEHEPSEEVEANLARWRAEGAAVADADADADEP